MSFKKRGLIHVYTGNGKGKTTAALGLAMRAAGWGWKVLIIQFLKGKMDYGERRFINELRTKNLGLRTKKTAYVPIKSGLRRGEVEIESFGREGFVDSKKLTKKDFEEAEKALKKWQTEMASGRWEMIILDEINVAIKFGLIPLSKALNLIKNKPKDLELVLTGRWTHPEIIKIADYVTEFKEIKHPYKKGIKARSGAEY